MQAALGVSQLKKLPKFIEIRKHNFNFLFKEFSKFDHFELPVWEKNSDPSWFGFPLSVKEDAGFTRNELLKHYDKNNIGTRLLFAGNITLQPAYIDLNLGSFEEFPVANKVVEKTFGLEFIQDLMRNISSLLLKLQKNSLIQYN